jgi:hypothetical protein
MRSLRATARRQTRLLPHQPTTTQSMPPAAQIATKRSAQTAESMFFTCWKTAMCSQSTQVSTSQDGICPKAPVSLTVGGPSHSLPQFFWFRQDFFSFLDSLTVFCVTKNQTDKQKTASNFSTPWKSPPPHDHKDVFSFQQPCLINSLIGNCQCMYFSIVRALTILIFCFSCSCGRSYKKTLFLERLLTMTTMKTSSYSLCPPFHNTAMVLC